MANEKHDPWALLRKARATLEYVGQVPTGERNSRARALERRIDAALAEHDAVPPSEEKVEWFPCGDDWAAGGGKPGLVLDVMKHGSGWSWTAELHLKAGGYCDTLDEAKSAAIAAAKGMR